MAGLIVQVTALTWWVVILETIGGILSLFAFIAAIYEIATCCGATLIDFVTFHAIENKSLSETHGQIARAIENNLRRFVGYGQADSYFSSEALFA